MYSHSLVGKGEILVSVLLPLQPPGLQISYYRQGRRSKGDLAVTNLGLLYNEAGMLRLLVGGTGSGLGGPAPPVVEVTRTAELVAAMKADTNLSKNINLTKASKKALTEALMEDLGFGLGHCKVALSVAFLESWLRGEKSQHLSYGDFQSSQVYEEVGPGQEVGDPVSRPLPHATGREQLQGSALYVDDLPRMSREVELYPVVSTQARATILGVEVEAALAVPGVVAWVAAKDVPGLNMWSVGETPDEEVFPSKEVVYVGQIVGLLAAENKQAGLKGVK